MQRCVHKNTDKEPRVSNPSIWPALKQAGWLQYIISSQPVSKLAKWMALKQVFHCLYKSFSNYANYQKYALQQFKLGLPSNSNLIGQQQQKMKYKYDWTMCKKYNRDLIGQKWHI